MGSCGGGEALSTPAAGKGFFYPCEGKDRGLSERTSRFHRAPEAMGRQGRRGERNGMRNLEREEVGDCARRPGRVGRWSGVGPGWSFVLVRPAGVDGL